MLRLSQSNADLLVPDGSPLRTALARTTCLGVGAHPDDLEFWMYYPILRSSGVENERFTGVTVTNGSGSARSGAYENFSDADIIAVRRREQIAAARIGKYSAMLQLGHPSSAVKDQSDMNVVDDLEEILRFMRPEKVYTHDLFDRHDTHRCVLLKLVEAIRRLPMDMRPKELIGCEGWSGLEWLVKKDRLVMDLSSGEKLAGQLINCFPSQILGGKRYDLAVQGRRRANATFLDSHAIDTVTSVAFGVNMSDLINENDLELYALAERYMRAFYEEKMDRLA